MAIGDRFFAWLRRVLTPAHFQRWPEMAPAPAPASKPLAKPPPASHAETADWQQFRASQSKFERAVMRARAKARR